MSIRLQSLSSNQAALLRFAISNLKENPETWITNEDFKDLEHLHDQLTLKLKEYLDKTSTKHYSGYKATYQRMFNGESENSFKTLSVYVDGIKQNNAVELIDKWNLRGYNGLYKYTLIGLEPMNATKELLRDDHTGIFYHHL